MLAWIKHKLLFISVSKYGWYLYIHFIPKYTIVWSIEARHKNRFINQTGEYVNLSEDEL